MQSVLVGFVFVGLIIAVQCQLPAEAREQLLGHHNACVGQTGVDQNLVNQARQGTFQDDPRLRAFAFCMSRRLGFQNESGQIQREVVRQRLAGLLGADVANQLVTTCLMDRATPEETASAAFRCYYETTPTRIVIF
ncbi:B1 protein-like [Rhynchophorus ferrugineus]|uniref:B1 protein-like n=1 Tax=Rhynchophorus ferrugineus TaxID=354439 RepID=UPI003FCC73BF